MVENVAGQCGTCTKTRRRVGGKMNFENTVILRGWTRFRKSSEERRGVGGNLPSTARFDYASVVAASRLKKTELESGYPVHAFRHAVINIGVTGLKTRTGTRWVAFRVPWKVSRNGGKARWKARATITAVMRGNAALFPSPSDRRRSGPFSCSRYYFVPFRQRVILSPLQLRERRWLLLLVKPPVKKTPDLSIFTSNIFFFFFFKDW